MYDTQRALFQLQNVGESSGLGLSIDFTRRLMTLGDYTFDYSTYRVDEALEQLLVQYIVNKTKRNVT